MSGLRPFHLAVPVHDLSLARSFYGDLIGCSEGRSASRWVDFDLYGHQLVCHLDKDRLATEKLQNPVDGDAVPVPSANALEFKAFADDQQIFAK